MSDNRKRRFSKVYKVPTFQVDDIVTVDGYGDTLFQVDGYTIEGYRGPDVSTDHIVYDMTGVLTGEWTVADQEDINLVCKAKDADQYLQTIDLDMQQQQTYFLVVNNTEEGDDDMPKEELSKHREYEKAEVKRRKDYRKKINRMMDEFNRLKENGDNEKAEKLMQKIKVEGLVFHAGGYVEKEGERK